MHNDSAYTKNQCQQRVDQGCPLSTCQFSAAVDPCSSQFWQNFAHITTQALNSLLTLMTGACGSNRSTYYRQSLLSQQQPDQSTLLHSPLRHRCGEPLARTPLHLRFKTRSHSHSVAWEDIFKFMATSNAPCWSGRADLHRENNTTLSENCHHACRP